MKQENFFVMDYDEFNNLVRANFPSHPKFHFVDDEECANDTDHAYMQMGAPSSWKPETDPAWIAKSEQDDIDEFEKWERGEEVICFGISQIIEGMIRKGILQPGNYLIQVSW